MYRKLLELYNLFPHSMIIDCFLNQIAVMFIMKIIYKCLKLDVKDNLRSNYMNASFGRQLWFNIGRINSSLNVTNVIKT